jgi:hypothetical protein
MFRNAMNVYGKLLFVDGVALLSFSCYFGAYGLTSCVILSRIVFFISVLRPPDPGAASWSQQTLVGLVVRVQEKGSASVETKSPDT